MKPSLLLSALLGTALPAAAPAAPADHSIQAIRYGTIKDFPVSALVIGAPKDEKTDIAMVVWLIRGGGRNVLSTPAFIARPGSSSVQGGRPGRGQS